LALISQIARFFKRGDDTAYHLYGAVVAQARQDAFYTEFQVPDTLDGRFDMIVLHAILVFRRLEAIGPRGHQLAQRTFDIMFRDMDQSLREMGVGDLSVPKKIKAMAQAFYGRADAYAAALDGNGEETLADVLTRNIYPEADGGREKGARLARYVARTAAFLDTLTFEMLQTGEIAFPDPAHLQAGHDD